MLGFILQEYKPYMFWMNMIDAFYQSLVCFFVPYFVSVGSIPISSCLSVFLLVVVFTRSCFPLSTLWSCRCNLPSGLRWLRRGSVYVGNSHHYHSSIHHPDAFRDRDQNLGKRNALISGDRPSFESFQLFALSHIPTSIQVLCENRCETRNSIKKPKIS